MRDKLAKQLEVEISRRNIDLVTQYVIENEGGVQALVELVLENDPKVSHRAAWALEKVSEKQKEPAAVYLPMLVEQLNNFHHSGIRRCIAKVLMMHQIPETLEGEVLDFCLNMIESAKEPVAVKANCMAITFSLLPKYPELKNEVFEIIKQQIPFNSVGFVSRFKVLKRKYKM